MDDRTTRKPVPCPALGDRGPAAPVVSGRDQDGGRDAHVVASRADADGDRRAAKVNGTRAGRVVDHLALILPLVAVVLFAWASLSSLWQLSERDENELRANRVGSWFTLQLLQSTFEVRSAVDEVVLSAPEQLRERRDALQERLDVLWSRVPLLGSGEAGPVIRQLIPVNEVVDELSAGLDRIDRLMPDLGAGTFATRKAITAELDAILGRAKDIALTLHRERLERVAELEATQARSKREIWLKFLGMFVSFGALATLLLHRTRRVQRLLGAEEAARGEADQTRRDLAAVLDTVPVMISAIGPDGRYVFANRQVAGFHGVAEQALVGTPFDSVQSDPAVVAATRAVLGGAAPDSVLEHGLLHAPTGIERVMLTAMTPVLDSNGVLQRVVQTSMDITDRKAAEQRIHHLALHDALTGLPNRAFFRECLQTAVAASTRLEQHFALHLIDLDRFKEVNDTLGHHVGDALLIAATQRMSRALRDGDVLGRLGGDEFAMIQRSALSPDDAERSAARLIAALSRPFAIEGHEVLVTASVGYTTSDRADPQSPDGIGAADQLLRMADLALYAAKNAGRNRAHAFADSMNEALRERRALEEDLRDAIENDDLRLYYQPIVDVVSGAVVAAEALLRWPHAERGMVPPDRFIPIAEDTGQIVPLSAWVIAAACREARRWAERYGRIVPIAVNISPVHFAQGTLEHAIDEAIERSGAVRPSLQIEVTERLLIENAQAAQSTMERIRASGVRIALDDFGTGYSSLGYLQRFPFDKLKIDRSFVASIDTDDRAARNIVEAIIQLAHRLGLKVVAEGVERPTQMAKLRELGCDQAQGYLFGRAMPAADLEQLLDGVPGDPLGPARPVQPLSAPLLTSAEPALRGPAHRSSTLEPAAP